MWLSTYHLSSNLIWFDLLYFIRRSSGPPICLFLYLSSPVLSCPILSYMSFRSCDMCIYLVIYRFPFFLYIFIELNRLIDPSVYPLRCTHGTRRCTTRGRPKWMHLPRPSGWKKSRRPMVWCIRRWQNARFKKCWKLGGSTVLPAFSILSDILSHSWYPMIIPCYPMVIF